MCGVGTMRARCLNDVWSHEVSCTCTSMECMEDVYMCDTYRYIPKIRIGMD